jgi:intergrase/recombinase
MKLEYTEHAELKLKERRISKSEIETILKNPEAVLLDVETGYLVAVGNRVYRQGHRLLVIYSPGEIIKLITVIDTSRTEIIKTREKKGRWVKIK